MINSAFFTRIKAKSHRIKTKTNTHQFKLTIATITTALIKTNILTPRRK